MRPQTSSGVNATATVTFPGHPQSVALTIKNITACLSATPAAPVILAIYEGGTNRWAVDIATAGVFHFPELNMQLSPGVQVDITLNAAGVGVIGRCNVVGGYGLTS